MIRDRDLRKLLREPTPDLVRATLEEKIEWGDFLADDHPEIEISGLGQLVAEWRGTASPIWTGRALLSNWAPTPIVIDGESFASVESFYHALKYDEGSSEREAVAMLDGPGAQHYALRHRGRTFLWRGREIEVGSTEHAALVSEAIVAKVRRHPNVAAALRETRRARIVFPYGVALKNALAKATPPALMIERAKLHAP